MHFHLPKPLHGWREFAGEVAIIVLGVLIALGAEQAVETWHWRGQVNEFRHAVDDEVAANLATYQYRLSQGDCVTKRLADLQRWHDAAQGGTILPMTGEIGRPSIVTIKTTTWESRGETMSHMPLDQRLNYAAIYNGFENVRSVMLEERDVWLDLAAFNKIARPSADILARMNALLYRASVLDRILRGNWRQSHDRVVKLGIRPGFGTSQPYIPPPDPQFCKPILRGA
jgi:hypothetical protein